MTGQTPAGDGGGTTERPNDDTEQAGTTAGDTAEVGSRAERCDAAETGEQFCPGCGKSLEETAEHCPDCGADHLPPEAFESLVETAGKDRAFGVWWIRIVPVLLPVVVWRQERIEAAQRDLLAYRSEFDDEHVHCGACGAELERDDPACDACGHANRIAEIEALEVDVHDPDSHETSVSGRWWPGVVVGPVIAIAGLMVAGLLGNVLLWGGGLLAAGAALIDRRYVRARAPWSPSYLLVVGLVVPVLSAFLALYYWQQRNETVG